MPSELFKVQPLEQVRQIMLTVEEDKLADAQVAQPVRQGVQTNDLTPLKDTVN